MNRSIPATIDDVDGCHSLILLEIREPAANSLLLVAGESSLSKHNEETPPVPGAQRVAHGSGGDREGLARHCYLHRIDAGHFRVKAGRRDATSDREYDYSGRPVKSRYDS